MTHKRVIASLLSMILFWTTLPGVTFAESDLTHRKVYLHAQGPNPTATVDTSTVYLGDTVDLYFAIDKPNRGRLENGVHMEPQYDLNGYTVKIYYDPEYFALPDNVNASRPIDYKVPDSTFNDETGTVEGERVPTKVGYFEYDIGATPANVNGKTYHAAYVTVFFSGEWLPQKDGLWYNLCKIPLVPLRRGSTDVFIDTTGQDPYTLELFAKDVSSQYGPTFTYSAQNSGYHHIIIKDRQNPPVPVADPRSGSFCESQSVRLTAEGCTIYYTTDGSEPKNNPNAKTYTGPILVEYTQDIKCYAVRTSDRKESSVVTYHYEILPTMPKLYDASNAEIPNTYTDEETSPFTVYASYDGMSLDSAIYYTFHEGISAESPIFGSDPETSWVKVERADPSIDIDRYRVVRLMTDKKGERSDVNWYYLGIRPDKVVADKESGTYKTKVDVALSTTTKGAEIFYTLDGSDPRSEVSKYRDVPLTLDKDVTLRAVAKYDGVYSAISSYYYLFSEPDNYGVDAFYPAGVYEGEVYVTLTPRSPNHWVEYSIDGGLTWEPYTEVLTFDRDTVLETRSVDEEGQRGGIYPFHYVIEPQPPAFTPEIFQFTNASEITVYCIERDPYNADRYELYYTIGGGDPITEGILADAETDKVDIPINGYTIVSAAIRKDGTTWSDVVTHSYAIVTQKPIKPIATLTPGHYTHEIGATDGFSTTFMPVSAGTDIYYTVSDVDGVCADPIPGTDGTILYDGTPITLKGKTTIKAVAVNAFGVKSDIALFEYTITPEAPRAAPSVVLGGNQLPLVPVEAVQGSTVSYQVGEDFENSFVCNVPTFYLDTQTGSAYADKERTQRLGDPGTANNVESAEVKLWATLDGVASIVNWYSYRTTGDADVLAVPYADRETGLYEEIKIDEENHLLLVRLYSLNEGADIEYRYGNNGTWESYDGNGLRLSGDTTLQIRARRGDATSAVVSYVYHFVPLPPILTLESGQYTLTDPLPHTYIRLDEERAPDPKTNYSIFYQQNGKADTYRLAWNNDKKIEIDHTLSIKAYVKNETTGRVSSNAVHYYVVESAAVSSGAVEMDAPYYGIRRLSAHLLDKAPWSSGIRLFTQTPGAQIYYSYSYTRTDGQTFYTGEVAYDPAAPIFVNNTMKSIRVSAKLRDAEGNELPDSARDFEEIVFVDLKIPQPSLEQEDKVSFTKGKEYTIENDHPNDPNTVIYYTLDGNDPADETYESRILYQGETLRLSDKSTTVRTVYYNVCGTCYACRQGEKCWNEVYGETGTFRYGVDTPGSTTVISGGGGGTVVVDKTRQYTVDCFGQEHPTHVGYIHGYPDGGVRPDGDITREEVAAILYRIKSHDYEAPFYTTGERFPDVAKDRWSATEIEYMAENGVIVGYPDETFKPTRNLTRGEFSALIRRFAGISEIAKTSPFTDLGEGYWGYEDVLAMLGAGLMSGYDDGSFRPEDPISRAEVMTVINRLLGRNPSEPYVRTLDFNPFNDISVEQWHYVIVLEATVTHNYYLDDKGVEIKWEDCR